MLYFSSRSECKNEESNYIDEQIIFIFDEVIEKKSKNIQVVLTEHATRFCVGERYQVYDIVLFSFHFR